jgi:hypothetical protein
MRWQAFAVAWSAGDGHELQRLRRRLLVAADKEPSLRATVDVLAARDDAEQKQRSEAAVPKARTFELTAAR